MIHDPWFDALLIFSFTIGTINVLMYLCQLDRLHKVDIIRPWAFMLMAATLLMLSRWAHREAPELAEILNNWSIVGAGLLWCVAGIAAIWTSQDAIMTTPTSSFIAGLRRLVCPFGGQCWLVALLGSLAAAVIGSWVL